MEIEDTLDFLLSEDEKPSSLFLQAWFTAPRLIKSGSIEEMTQWEKWRPTVMKSSNKFFSEKRVERNKGVKRVTRAEKTTTMPRGKNFPFQVVFILRKWYSGYNGNYPDSSEKQMIVKEIHEKTGIKLTLYQVNNWFTNTRHRDKMVRMDSSLANPQRF